MPLLPLNYLTENYKLLMSTTVADSNVLNVNVGILGHVDSGKTSLVKALSTCLSTAALDKNPQSVQRGITLDLGFSSFSVDLPEQLKQSYGNQYEALQFTLVDCPGHASLIRTIIGGAQIIDIIILVIDVNKGIQTQTAECIVIGEITTDNLIVVLNKVDMVPHDERELRVGKSIRKIQKIFSKTKFPNPRIIVTSAASGGEKVTAISDTKCSAGNHAVVTEGIEDLVELLRSIVRIRPRDSSGPFLFAVDHCFAIKGHGTVMTGTVISGSVSVNSIVEIPDLRQQRKVKSIQMFRRPVRCAVQGDRVGLCVTNLDPDSIERGLVAAPGTVPTLSHLLCLVRRVRFYRSPCKSYGKVHVSIGHSTVLASVIFFGAEELKAPSRTMDSEVSSVSVSGRHGGALNYSYMSHFPDLDYDWTQDFVEQGQLVGSEGSSGERAPTSVDMTQGHEPQGIVEREPLQWAYLQLQQPTMIPSQSLVIASRLDGDYSGSSTHGEAHHCRLVFYGIVRASLGENETRRLRIFRHKVKTAAVHRLTDVRGDGRCFGLVGWQLVGAAAGLRPFLGMRLETEFGDTGLIVAPFGNSGKFQVKFAGGATGLSVGSQLFVRFKRFVFDKDKRMVQTDGPETIDSPTATPDGARMGGAPVVEDFPPPPPPVGSDGRGDPQVSADVVDYSITIVQDEATVSGTEVEHVDLKPAGEGEDGAVCGVEDSDDEKESPAPAQPSMEVRVGVIELLKESIGEVGGTDGLYVLAVVSGAFSMSENIRDLGPATVEGPHGEEGLLCGPFGKLGKCKVSFPSGTVGPVGATVRIMVPVTT